MFSQRITMNYICIALAVLGLVQSKPSSRDVDAIMKMFSEANKEVGRNSALENLIINSLEDFRQTMIHGSGNVPVLDPFQANRVYVDDNIVPIAGARLELQNLVVANLSTFNVNKVDVTSTSIILQRYRVIVELDVPEIDVKAGSYDLFGSVDGLTLFGAGTAHINLGKPDLAVDALVGMRLGVLQIFLNIIELRVDIAFEAVKIELTGMFNNPAVDSFVNTFLENLIMQLQKYYADDLSNLISPIIKDIANTILDDINLIDILS